MAPRSKFDWLVLTNRLVEAGLTLIAETEKSEKSDFERAQAIRNGLIIAILGVTQIRLRNFVALEIGSTFKEVNGSWWISVPAGSTKNKRGVEKRIPNSFNNAIELYLNQARPILMRLSGSDNSLWISSRTGRRFTYKKPPRWSASAAARHGRRTSSAARCRLPRQPPRPKAEQFVLHAKALHGNPYDGHTLGPVIADLEKLTGVAVRRIHGDKGYRGHNYPNRFRVWISGQVRRVTKVVRREMRRRAAVEPVIGHLKDDHRMRRNYLKGRNGDRINAVLAAAGYNFSLLLRWFEELLRVLLMIICRSRSPRLLLG